MIVGIPNRFRGVKGLTDIDDKSLLWYEELFVKHIYQTAYETILLLPRLKYQSIPYFTRHKPQWTMSLKLLTMRFLSCLPKPITDRVQCFGTWPVVTFHHSNHDMDCRRCAQCLLTAHPLQDLSLLAAMLFMMCWIVSLHSWATVIYVTGAKSTLGAALDTAHLAYVDDGPRRCDSRLFAGCLHRLREAVSRLSHRSIDDVHKTHTELLICIECTCK